MDWKSMGQWFNSTFRHFELNINMNIKTIDFLTQIKNASLYRKETVKSETNYFTTDILKALYNEGYILSFRIAQKKQFQNETSDAIVAIRYVNNKPLFNELKITSSPSFKKVVSYKNLCRVLGKKTLFLFTTHLGLLNLTECQKHRTGGFLLFINN